MHFELSGDEVEALKEVLDEKLVHLAWEINRTDHLELKNALKGRERTLDHLVELLSHTSATPPPSRRPM